VPQVDPQLQVDQKGSCLPKAQIPVRGRRVGALPAKFRREGRWGVEKEWSVSITSSRRTFRGSWEGEGMTRGEVPTAAKAAARRSSSVRGFPVKKAA
jgi:hypothetical protein